MSYLTWDYRCVPFFIEEKIKNNVAHYHLPSIKTFQEGKVYTVALRTQLTDYINNCYPMIGATIERINPYTGDSIWDFAYFTDGEIIFNNLLLDYIQRDNFAIPASWLKLIQRKNFKVDKFELDYEAADIFQTKKETFAQVPTIKKAMRF